MQICGVLCRPPEEMQPVSSFQFPILSSQPASGTLRDSNMALNGEQAEQQPSYRGHAGVVGAGIAGLSAAVALRRAGWQVDIFERSQSRSEIGAAITVTPNATLVLDRWGFDMEKAAAFPNQAKRLALANQPSVVLQREEYVDMADRFGHGAWSFHRVDLHRGLKDLAVHPVDNQGMGPPVDIKLGSDVAGVDCEQGILKLADGRTVKKDLVVIADGAHVRAFYARISTDQLLTCRLRAA